MWGPGPDGGSIFYEPFLADLRTSWPERFFHPACWAKEYGVDALLELIHIREAKNRSLAWEVAELRREVERMRTHEL
jgi:hypothetical protein